MRQCLFLTIILAILFLPSCVPLIEETIVRQQSPTWTDYQNMDRISRNERISTLRRELNDCLTQFHCADLHNELAMAYLSSPVIGRKALVSANLHLQKAAQGWRHKDHALLLSKVVRQLIHKADQQAILERQVERLEIKLERAKAVDLETLSED